MAGESFDISASNMDAMKKSADALGKSTKDATDKIKDFEKAAKGLGFGGIKDIFSQQRGLAESLAKGMGLSASDLLSPTKRVLPSMPTVPVGRSINWRQALLGAAVSPFSPYFGARTISQSGIFGTGGGGGGGMASALGGPAGFGRLVPVIAGAILVMHAFKAALHAMINAVERGSRLYQNAAMLGRPTEQVARAQLALQGIGISPDQTNRLLMNAQFARKGMGASERLSDILLRSSASMGQVGEIQQIKNMSKELEWMSSRSQFAAEHMAKSAGALQRIGMQAAVFKNSWSAAFQSMTAEMEPVIRLLLAAGTGFSFVAGNIGKIMRVGRGLMNPLSLLPNPITKLIDSVMEKAGGKGPGNQQIAGSLMGPVMFSQWQRIGLQFGNFGGHENYARQTAVNTRKIAEAVTRKTNWSTPYLNPMMGGFGPLSNLP